MVRVKVCGIRSREEALWCLEAGVHALGLVFYPPSPRYVPVELARELVSSTPPLVLWVGVFVDEPPEKVLEVSKWVGLNTVQLHGSEPPEVCQLLQGEGLKVIKAIRVYDAEDLEGWELYKGKASALLLDTKVRERPGGSGRIFDWNLAKVIRDVPLILAGGLNPRNVKEALRTVRPFGVDVSSGVEEAPGRKNPQLIQEFMKEVLSA